MTLEEEIEQLKNEVAELTRETQADNTIIADYKRVLDAIPACPAHGSDCVPHAVEWVERVKTLGATITGFDSKD